MRLKIYTKKKYKNTEIKSESLFINYITCASKVRFSKFRDEKRTFQSSRTKNETYV